MRRRRRGIERNRKEKTESKKRTQKRDKILQVNKYANMKLYIADSIELSRQN